MSGFVVRYMVTGFEGERTTETYAEEREAHSHADDIRSYEEVQNAIVVHTDEPRPRPMLIRLTHPAPAPREVRG